jgi:hypothetical protein
VPTRDDASHEKLNGAAVSLATTAPLTSRSTRVTPTLSLAFTSTATVPLTVPPVGELMLTVGGVESDEAALATVTDTVCEFATLPAAS